jgi:hypothetical protein
MPVKGKTPLFLDRTESFYLGRPSFKVGIALWMTSDVVMGTNMHATTYLQWYTAE